MTITCWLGSCCARGQEESQSFQGDWRHLVLVPHKGALCALLQPEVSLLCDGRAVSGLVPHRGTAGCPGGRAEPVPLDLPAKDSMEVLLKADTSQEIGLLTLTSPFLWEFVESKGCVLPPATPDGQEGHFWCPGKDSCCRFLATEPRKGFWEVQEVQVVLNCSPALQVGASIPNLNDSAKSS